MKRKHYKQNDYAVSVVIGGMLLVLIAVTSFSLIYLNVSSEELDVYNTNVRIEGSVTDDGLIVLEHKSGETIRSYKVYAYYSNDTLIGTHTYKNDNWAIGEYRYPLQNITDIKLVDETISVNIGVYAINEDGKEQEIFKGELFGKVDTSPSGQPPEGPGWNPEIPLLVSSLQTDTIDEDLICYALPTIVNSTQFPDYYDYDIDMNWQVDNDDVNLVESKIGLTGTPGWIREDVNNDGIIDNSDKGTVDNNYGLTKLTYIYNWILNGKPITNIILPFDTNNDSSTLDYSNGGNHGTVNNATWSNNGVIGGCYHFNGFADISLPYCFENGLIDEITVETWIKTNQDNLAIASFNQDKYWGLNVKNNLLQFITSTNDENAQITSNSNINDNNWHYLATTYKSNSGESKIYIDGVLENNENVLNPGDYLGDNSNPTGYIAKGTGSPQEETIFSTSFETQTEENKWSKNEDRTDDWLNRGFFERLSDESLSSRTGSFSIGGTGDMTYWYSSHHAAYDREAIDISDYSDVKVSLWYSYYSTEYDDEFGVYYWDGSSWEPIFQDFNPNIGEGNQLDWTYIEVEIPDYIDDLILQFWWSTSSSREYFAIDDLQVTGMPNSGSCNFIGYIDEFRIYNRVLSDEQIYQNYITMNDDFTDRDILVSDETAYSNIWQCTITPNDSTQDGETIESEIIQIGLYGGG